MSSANTPPRGNIYVTSQGLLNLRNEYKYSGADKSLIAAQMQPFWNKAVLWIPESMAPNMVTLVGLFFILLSFFLAYYHSPLLQGPVPWYVCVLHAVCLFAYQTLDALDGKHARRTLNSSALGELFDHGCDAVSTTMLVLTVSSVLEIGPSLLSFWVVLVSNLVFFTAQWEQYTVGTLVLGYINVTEAQFTMMALCLWTAVSGSHFWLNTFQIAGYTFRYHHVVVFIQSSMIFMTIAGNLWNVWDIVKQRKLSFVKVFGQLVPAVVATVLSTVWVLNSPTKFLLQEPVPFLLALGFLFPNLVGRIVFARMCKADFSWFQFLVIPLALGVFNALTKESIMEERYFIIGLLAFYVLAYAHFAKSVIDVLCALLQIKCLTPKPKPRE